MTRLFCLSAWMLCMGVAIHPDASTSVTRAAYYLAGSSAGALLVLMLRGNPPPEQV